MSGVDKGGGWQDLAPAALRSFFTLAQLWKLTEREQVRLLGLNGRYQLLSCKTGSLSGVSEETVERISYLLGIFKAINTLLPDQARADQWMRAPNAAPPFGGRSALDRMVDGDISDLRVVRKYVDGQLG